jgi:hypothetical protein
VVTTTERRDHHVPVRYRDAAQSHQLIDVSAPDRVSGGQWEEGYAREYFVGMREDGVLVWVFRDAIEGEWFLHGVWD